MKLLLCCLSALLLVIRAQYFTYGDTGSKTGLKRYFVVLTDYSNEVKSASVEHGQSMVGEFLRRHLMLTLSRVHQQAYQLPQVREYTPIIVGYSTLIDDVALNAIKKMSDVDYVEEDAKTIATVFPFPQPIPGLPPLPFPIPPGLPNPFPGIRLPFGPQRPFSSSLSAQTNALWHLDRINQRRLPLDKKYSPTKPGDGVDIYIVDSGIRYTHEAFEGRATFGGFDFQPFTAPNGPGSDCNGHGTHVAGLAGGFAIGPATGARLYSIRVLGCGGQGTLVGFVGGINHVILTRDPNRKSILSMSLGFQIQHRIVDTYLKMAIDQNILPVTAAGNDFRDACNSSPASSKDAITVGATDIRDNPASFTNYGSCVDIFAPGDDITSADSNGDRMNTPLSGTSMATPIVSGVSASLWQQYTWMNARELISKLLAESTRDILNFSILPFNQRTQTPNLMLFQQNAVSGTAQSMSTESKQKLEAEEASVAKQLQNVLRSNYLSRFKSVLASRARDQHVTLKNDRYY